MDPPRSVSLKYKGFRGRLFGTTYGTKLPFVNNKMEVGGIKICEELLLLNCFLL